MNGKQLHETVVQNMWTENKIGSKHFWTKEKDLGKYHIDNFLLQLVAIGVANLEALTKKGVDNKENLGRKKDDCMFLLNVGHDGAPTFFFPLELCSHETLSSMKYEEVLMKRVYI